MGVSTDGQINYGIPFEEGFEFPWSEDGDGDIEAWWRTANGYENPMFNPFDESGNYKPGVSRDDPRIGEYFAHQREWMKANPIPVEDVNYCSGDYPMILLAVPGLGLSCSRGDPEAFDPASLVATTEQRQSLLDFCKRWGIEVPSEPAWYLTSYWG